MENGAGAGWTAMLALVGAALSLGTLGYWVWVVWRVRVPRQLATIRVSMIAGAVLSLAALWVGGVGTGLTFLAGLGLASSSTFLALDRIAAVPRHAPSVSVGARAPEFDAPTATRERFSLASMRGRPVLLKFFRGYW